MLLVPFIVLIVAASTASPSGSGGELDLDSSDWSQCPRSCKCKWSSGKRTADCEAGGFTELPLDFPRPDLIQVLIMNHNPLRTLPPRAFHLAGLINVQKVFMKNCSLNNLDPTALAGLVILIELDLSDNHLLELKQGTFQGNIRLRKLHMASNSLSSLASFSFPTKMIHLRLIDLSFNRLAQLDAKTFTNLGPNLEVLHLNNNNFKRLSVRPFISLHHLKSLRLEGNPWHCDCKLRDLWHWLQAKRLLLTFNSASCASPTTLKGRHLHDLDAEEHLACAPIVTVPQPRVPVTRDRSAVLPCKLEEGEAAQVTWLREGVAVKANRSSEAVMYGQYYVIYQGGRWYNLSIGNIQPPTSSDLYTCVASNEGGISEANVTLVFSPNVATYVGDGEAVISWLLTGGVASGVLIFLGLSLWLLICSVQKARRRRHTGHLRGVAGGLVPKPQNSTEPLNNGHLLDSAGGPALDSKLTSRTASLEAVVEDASNYTGNVTFEEQQLRQTTALARAQRTKGLKQNSNLNSEVKVNEDKDWSNIAEANASAEAAAATQHTRGYPDLLDCHQNNYLMMMEMTTAQQHQQQPPPPPFQPQIHSWRPVVQTMTSSRPQQYGSVTLANYGSSVAAPRGYFNQMATLRPSPASTGGQLSDPDSGFFSSSNETWLGSDPQSATSTAMLIDSASSPLSSSSSMLSHPQQNNSQNTNQIIPNNKLLAHTLENRKRVLHSLMREKTDTLV